MQTKQQRLRYGEQLRRQIQMKQEQKRASTMEKRKHTEQSSNNPNFITAAQRQEPTSVTTRNQRPKSIYQQPQNQEIQVANRKEMYQKKLEEEAYFPFGKLGVRAGVNKNREERVNVMNQERPVKPEYDYASHQPVSQPSQPNPNTVPIYNPQHYIAQQQQMVQQRVHTQVYAQQPQYQPSVLQYPPQMYQPYAQPINQYHPSMQQIPPPNPQYQYPPQNYYQPSMMDQRAKLYQQPPQQQSRLRQQYYQPSYQKSGYENTKGSSKQIASISSREQEPSYQQRVQSSQQNRAGKRNILLYQNQTNEAISKKMRNKEEARGILQEQMKEKKRLKQQEDERIRREDLKLEAENKRYIEMENKKIEEEINEKRRKEEAKRESEERSRQMREKMDREAQEQKKKKRMNIPEYVAPVEVVPSIEEQQRVYPNQRQRVRQGRVEPEREQTSVEPESEEYYHTIEKAFNTDVSRDAIRQEKQRDGDRMKKDKQFNQLKKNINNMKSELINHNQIHKLEREKAILEIERMKLEKEKAEQEVYRLRQELNQKKDDRSYEERLRLAMKNTERDVYEDHVPTPKPMKPKEEEMFVKKTYSYEVKEPLRKVEYPPEQKQYLVHPKISNLENQYQDGLQSLYGQTVKIPINLGGNNLTMSNVDQFDVRNLPKQSSFAKQPQHQSIDYEDPVKREFRKHLSGEDELDKLIKQPPKQYNKWGQMSSIDSQGTKQIEQLLKEHQFQYGRAGDSGRPDSRPHSKLSNLGKQSLNGGIGYAADGFTLQSNVNDGTYNTNMNDGTFNLMKINENNDRRLSRLRQMGVDTVGQDEQINQLDRLLDKYSN